MAFSRTGSTDCMIPSLLSISLIYEPARRSGSYLRSEQSPVGRLCARAYDGMTTEIGGGVAAVGGVSAWASIFACRADLNGRVRPVVA